MLTLLRALVAVFAALFGLFSGCGGSKVTEASCSACGSESYSAEECRAFGEAVGCETSSFTPGTGSGCNNGCSFKNCDEPPSCGEVTGPVDPDSGERDAALDPRCAASDDGIFSSNPPCSNAQKFNLNGVDYFYCPCGLPCPCGYTCGGIPLSVGGTIGGACAPP